MRENKFKENLKYENDKIKIIEYGQEINIPKEYIMTYVTRTGQLILCKDLKDRSTHAYVAEEYFKIKKDKNGNEYYVIFNAIAKGNLMIADLSKDEDKSLLIGHRENSKTEFQENILKKLEEMGYSFLEDEYYDENLREMCGEIPVLKPLYYEHWGQVLNVSLSL